MQQWERKATMFTRENIQQKERGIQMSRYKERMQQAEQTDFNRYTWLDDFQGAAYSRMSVTTFREWAADIRHRVGNTSRVRKADIDAKLLQADVR